MAKINGKEVTIKPGMTVDEMLSLEGYSMEKIAVEKNGEILPKSLYHATVVEEEDTFEVVSFVGGG
mgnify:CR=1 FL=1